MSLILTEAIEHGSIALVLRDGILGPWSDLGPRLLRWLAEAEPTVPNLIIYHHLCQHDFDQQIGDCSFLEYRQRHGYLTWPYGLIAAYQGKTSPMPWLKEAFSNSSLYHRVQAISGRTEWLRLYPDVKVYYDREAVIEGTPTNLSSLISRWSHLMLVAPTYWTYVAQPYYQGWLARHHLASHPHFFPRWVTIDQAWYEHFRGQPFSHQAYYLGLPPDAPALVREEALYHLAMIGYSAYLDQCRDTHRQHRQTSWPDSAIHHTLNTLLEECDDYHPIDVISYGVSNHVYHFTREEWPFLLENRVNIWTNDYIPPILLHRVSSRMAEITTYQLPPSSPLYGLYYDHR